MSKLKKILLTIAILLGVVYLSGLTYFYFYTYPNTQVNDRDKGVVLKETLFDIILKLIKLQFCQKIKTVLI